MQVRPTAAAAAGHMQRSRHRPSYMANAWRGSRCTWRRRTVAA
jgi:hypothetical protein